MLKCPECGAININSSRYCCACATELFPEDDIFSIKKAISSVYFTVVGISFISLIIYVIIQNIASTSALGRVLPAALMVWLIGSLIGIPFILFYMSPTIIAGERTDIRLLFWINLLLGWTIIGWFMVLFIGISRDRNLEYQTLSLELRDLIYAIENQSEAHENNCGLTEKQLEIAEDIEKAVASEMHSSFIPDYMDEDTKIYRNWPRTKVENPDTKDYKIKNPRINPDEFEYRRSK